MSRPTIKISMCPICRRIKPEIGDRKFEAKSEGLDDEDGNFPEWTCRRNRHRELPERVPVTCDSVERRPRRHEDSDLRCLLRIHSLQRVLAARR